MTVRINKQKINLREKLAGVEDKVNFDEVVRGLGEYGGNVGIGTTNPAYALDINGDSDTGWATRIINDSTASEASGLIVRCNGGTSGDALRVHSDDKELFRVRNNGNVGIGTTSPNNSLHVKGSNNTVFDNISNVYLEGTDTYNSSNAGAGIQFGGKYDTSGNTTVFGQISAIKENILDGDYKGALTFGTRDGASLTMEAMRIDSAGNVGIGTRSPNQRLEVLKSGGGKIRLSETSARYVEITGYAEGDANGSTMTFSTNQSGTSTLTERMRINSQGNVGIGTTNPSGKLTIPTGESIHFNDTSGATKAEINSGAAGTLQIQGDFDLRFKTINEAMRIDSNGNVGIGTTDPGANKLYVGGNIYASGTITPSSDDRVKHNEQPIVGALETLSKITPKKYIKTTKMYDANHDFELDADGNPVDSNAEPVEHRIEAGVIAQQVLTVDELAFTVSPEGVDEDGTVTSPHGLDYNSLFTYAIAAIQEQQTIIEDLKSRIETLEQQ